MRLARVLLTRAKPPPAKSPPPAKPPPPQGEIAQQLATLNRKIAIYGLALCVSITTAGLNAGR